MTKKEIEKVLQDILDPLIISDEYNFRQAIPAPTYQDIIDFIKIIIEDKSEESLQKFISKHPNFIFKLMPSTDDTILTLISKAPIGNFKVSDYVMLIVSQGGCAVYMIEIERPSDRLFTNKLTPAQKLAGALGQVNDWKEHILKNQQSFLNSLFTITQALPLIPNKTANGSFNFFGSKQIRKNWLGFGGDEYCHFEYLIVIGRWSNLTSREKEKLIFLNNNLSKEGIRVRTFDNLIRKAIDGPKYLW